jgi:hypothetical protein
MSQAAATFLTVAALVLQAMGFATTCTQGADGSAITGAVLSTPPLLIACAIVALQLARGRAKPHFLAAIVVFLALLLTQDIWISTLAYGTPCGATYVDYPTSFVGGAIILFGYVLLPVVTIVLCLLPLLVRPTKTSVS